MTVIDALNEHSLPDLPRPTRLEAYNPIDTAEPYPERSQWLEERLNPEGTLPAISYAEDPNVLTEDLMPGQDPTPRPNECGYRIYDDVGEPAGKFILRTNTDPDDPTRTREHVSWIEVADAKKGQGYGRATYLAVLKALPNSATLVSDSSLSTGGQKIWRWLESHEVATQHNDIEDLTSRYVKSKDEKSPIFVTQVYKPDLERPMAPELEPSAGRIKRLGKSIVGRFSPRRNK